MKYFSLFYNVSALILLYSASVFGCDMKIYPPACPPGKMHARPGFKAKKNKENINKDQTNYLEVAQMLTPTSDPKLVAVGKSARGGMLFHVINNGLITPSYYMFNVYPAFYVRSHKGAFKLGPSEPIPFGRIYPIVQAGVLIKHNSSGLVKKTNQELQECENMQLTSGCAVS